MSDLNIIDLHVKSYILFSAKTQSRQEALEEIFLSTGNGMRWVACQSTGKMVFVNEDSTNEQGQWAGVEQMALYLKNALHLTKSQHIKEDDTPKALKAIINRGPGIELSNIIHQWIFDNIDTYCKNSYIHGDFDLRPKKIPNYFMASCGLTDRPNIEDICHFTADAINEMCDHIISLIPHEKSERLHPETVCYLRDKSPEILPLYLAIINFKNDYNSLGRIIAQNQESYSGSLHN